MVLWQNQDADVHVNLSGKLRPVSSTVDEKLPIALLFPGQGAQAVGMLVKAKDIPAVKELIATANEILGYDVLDLCMNGPAEKLKQTIYCQPAIFLASLAAIELLRLESPEKVHKCQCVAGFSLGEVTALVFSGAMSVEDGVKLVKLRAEAMDAATKMNGPQLMASVLNLPRSKVDSLIAQVKARQPHAVLQVANELFSLGFSCSGSAEAVEALIEVVKANGGMGTILPTSGAFHSPMMQPAVEPLTNACKELAPNLLAPNCAVYSNATAKPYNLKNSSQESFLELFPQQIVSPVLWDTLMKRMIADGVTEFIEVGPGKQLKSMMRRIDPQAWKSMSNFEA